MRYLESTCHDPRWNLALEQYIFDHADRNPNATRITHVGMLISPTEVIHCAGWVHVAKIEDMGIRLANGKRTHHLAQIKRYL